MSNVYVPVSLWPYSLDPPQYTGSYEGLVKVVASYTINLLAVEGSDTKVLVVI